MCSELNPLRGVRERMLAKLSPVFRQLQTLGICLDQAGEEKLTNLILEVRRPARVTSLDYPRSGEETQTYYKVWAPPPDSSSGDDLIIGEGEDIAQAIINARRYYDTR